MLKNKGSGKKVEAEAFELLLLVKISLFLSAKKDFSVSKFFFIHHQEFLFWPKVEEKCKIRGFKDTGKGSRWIKLCLHFEMDFL